MFQVVELPLKHHICKVQSLNKRDANSEVTVYYQVHAAERRLSSCSFGLKHICCVWGSVFLSRCTLFHLVWSQVLEGTHADGAVSGEYSSVSLPSPKFGLHFFCQSFRSFSPTLTELLLLLPLFQMHMEEPCFDFLRTKETLGWVSLVLFHSLAAALRQLFGPQFLSLCSITQH